MQTLVAKLKAHGDDYENFSQTLKRAAPACICPDCEGFGCPALASTCGGSGWVNGDRFAALNLAQVRKVERFKKKAS